MTAALGGRFGGRVASTATNYDVVPPTPGGTTVISGGTSLGNMASNNATPITTSTSVNAVSKSDSATTWRRGGNNNSVLSGQNRSVTSPAVKVTPPPSEQWRISPPPTGPNSTTTSAPKSRPRPLSFNIAVSQPMAGVALDETSEGEEVLSSGSSKSGQSSPTTPRSSSSNDAPLSPREEAAKKLYEGLGIGRPLPAATPASVANFRLASQPVRQPRGPPSGMDELAPKNFATRIRRKAVGSLGVLLGARERRDLQVEAF